MTIREQALAAAERCYSDLKPSADKRGRFKDKPYVPTILDLRDGPNKRGGRDGKEQILGQAYATRELAIEVAADMIERRKAHMTDQLLQIGARAFRRQWGLPYEITREDQSCSAR